MTRNVATAWLQIKVASAGGSGSGCTTSPRRPVLHSAAAWSSRFVHNVVAHPLLVLCPPLGEWLHARTDP